MKILISIIIAIFNRKNELFELLNSLAVQTDMDFEVLVIDDGSTIDLRDTVQFFTEKMQIMYFRKDNTGPGFSRNFGAGKAKNNWLLFLDSDVIVKKDYIQNVKKNMKLYPADAFGGADKSHRNFSLFQKAVSYSMTSILTTGGIRGNKRAISKFQPRSFNMGISKEVFNQVDGFSNMRIGEDSDLSMTLWENGYTTAFYDDIGVYHKRRTDVSKFSTQVYQFGIARPILNYRHPRYTKFTFWFPSMFLLVYFAGIVHYWVWNVSFILFLNGIYKSVLFLHALYKTKNVMVAFLCVITTYIQMFSYGWGFLKSWFVINVLKSNPQKIFPKYFYQ